MPAPIKLTIKFKASDLEEFVERYGVYVSQGGIFVRTKKPLSVGTVLDFEFKFQDGSSVLKGLGTVVWTREYDPARTNAPPGMGLRYDTLDEASKERLGKILGMKGDGAEQVEEKSPDAITSPGIQEEKTRVANIDILNKLRGVKEEEPEESVGAKSPASDLFDEPVENLKPDLDELTGAAQSAAEEKKSPVATSATPPLGEAKPAPNEEKPFVLEEKSAEAGGVQTDWQDEPTPIPSKIHPLITADEETINRDSIPDAGVKNASMEDEKELSVADEAKEEL
ncbi:TIGR02266 family protein, partial [Myxococcota bacterium]|nr:TIGR02266 family protein [Myxococcota bacterium]